MTTGKHNKTVWVLAAVAIVALAAGQIRAEALNVPNGEFRLYKPGTNNTVTAYFATAGNNYSKGVGENLPVLGGGLAIYSDGTKGGVVDCPGWTGPLEGSNTNDLWSSGIDNTDGTTCFNAFGTWSGGKGNLAESTELGVTKGGRTYTISAMVEGSGGPLVLELWAGGVALTPSSSVTPSLPTDGWQEISRTYDASAVATMSRPKSKTR